MNFEFVLIYAVHCSRNCEHFYFYIPDIIYAKLKYQLMLLWLLVNVTTQP